MPKDPSKNVDRYKVRGGHLNEYEFEQKKTTDKKQRSTNKNEAISNKPPQGSTPEKEAIASKKPQRSTHRNEAVANKKPQAVGNKSPQKATSKKAAKKK